MISPTLLAAPDRGRVRRLLTRTPRWLKILAAGASLWGLSVGVLFATGDEYVVAAVALGTFVVPLALAAGLGERGKRLGVAPQLMVRLAACGGLLGFLSSALLERPILSAPGPMFDGWVGVIEETSKLAILAFLTRSLIDRDPRTGFVLGGLVGVGFSAFESAGYAISTAINSGGNSGAVIEMVLSRATAAPFTHVLWTAVVGAALFASTRDGRFRAAPLLTTTLVAMAALHAGWDMMPALAADLRSWLAGTPPSPGIVVDPTVLIDSGEALLSAPPLYIAYRLLGRKRMSPAGVERPAIPSELRPPVVAHIGRSAA